MDEKEMALAALQAAKDAGERSEFCVTVKLLQRNHVIQSPVKIDG